MTPSTFRADVLAGSDASEEAMAAMNERGELARYRLLLFSTHGFLSYTHPQLSAIVLLENEAAPHVFTAQRVELLLPLAPLPPQLLLPILPPSCPALLRPPPAPAAHGEARVHRRGLTAALALGPRPLGAAP